MFSSGAAYFLPFQQDYSSNRGLYPYRGREWVFHLHRGVIKSKLLPVGLRVPRNICVSLFRFRFGSPYLPWAHNPPAIHAHLCIYFYLWNLFCSSLLCGKSPSLHTHTQKSLIDVLTQINAHLSSCNCRATAPAWVRCGTHHGWWPRVFHTGSYSVVTGITYF